MKSKLLTVIFCLALFLMIICFSIGLPIYIRPFYYAHIEPFDIPSVTGYDEATIRQAYNELLDYLVLPWKEFSLGVFPYSMEGKAHFEDCRGLFIANTIGLIASSLIVISLTILSKTKRLRLVTPRQFPPSFFVAIGTFVVFASLSLPVAVDIDTAFIFFHAFLFPEKDNWIFNELEDPIILALPQEFFVNCGIVIVSSVLIISLLLIIRGYLIKRSRSKTSD